MNYYYVIALTGVILAAISQAFLKYSSRKEYKSLLREYLNFPVITGYFLLATSMLCMILAYRGIPYMSGQIMEALGFPIILLICLLIFGEKISRRKVLGTICIMLGIVVYYVSF